MVVQWGKGFIYPGARSNMEWTSGNARGSEQDFPIIALHLTTCKRRFEKIFSGSCG
jgi:hypothetical protein